ncbi:MAG TPA: hypothetical protein VGH90_11425 [Chthoniobacteraceae bacterium]
MKADASAPHQLQQLVREFRGFYEKRPAAEGEETERGPTGSVFSPVKEG